MNIGEAVKALQKKYPSASISRIRFLEKEGLIKIKRSSGGTRKFSKKDIEKISKIIDLQENEFFSLKAIKNNPSLLRSSKTKSIKIDEITNIFVNQGVGKFSGIRASLAIVKGLRFANKVDIYGYNSDQIKDHGYDKIIDLFNNGHLKKNLIKPYYSS